MNRCRNFCLLPESLAALWLTALCAMAARPVDEPVGQIFVTTIPESAIVSCDGVLRDVAPLTIIDLAPGPHLVSATKQGHQDASKTVTVRANEKVAVELELEPVLGLVLVRSSPADADVQVDGAFRGRTPVLMTDLPIGHHRVQINKAGHSGREVDLNVKDRIPVKLDVNLASEATSIVVETTPPAAKITVDGISKDPAPCTIEMTPGEHSIEVALEGYQSFKQTFRLTAGRSETLKIELKELTAELRIVSAPSGAKVYIDNQFKGETPLTLQDMRPGSYRVRVQIQGYEPMPRDVILGRGQKLTEEFGLVSTCGAFEISTLPAGVRVVLDGKEAGVTAAKTNDENAVSEVLKIEMLEARKHQVELSRNGYASRTFSIDIEVGKTAAARGIRLERKFTPNFEVRTLSEVHRGVFVEKDKEGNIKLEIKPGVTVKFDASTIRSAQALP
jgi:hypothetical protein